MWGHAAWILAGRSTLLWILWWATCDEALRTHAVRVHKQAQLPSLPLLESISSSSLPSLSPISDDEHQDDAYELKPFVSHLSIITSTTTTTTTVTGTTSTTTTITEDLTPAPAELIATALEAHNRLRALHDAEPLEWCEKCYLEAKKQANRCQAANKLFFGSMGANHDQGQNLYSAGNQRMGTNAENVKDAVDSWYTQKSYPGYDFNKNMLQRGTQQFVQLVWKETKSVGLAVSEDGRFIVANYFPAGGQIGKFIQNVSPNPHETTTTTTTSTKYVPESITVTAERWTKKLKIQFTGCRDEHVIREARLALARNRKASRDESVKPNVVTTTKTTHDGQTTLEVKIITSSGTTTETIICQREGGFGLGFN